MTQSQYEALLWVKTFPHCLRAKRIPVAKLPDVQFNPKIKIMKTIKLTKLEQFVLRNPDMPFDVMASQLNRTYGTMERACDRAIKKTAGLSREQIDALLH